MDRIVVVQVYDHNTISRAGATKAEQGFHSRQPQ